MKNETQPESAKRSFRFMVVDDSEFARRNMEKIMIAMGGELAGFASNGREAVEQYPELRPDLVLMDVTMPEMEGVEAVEGILAADRSAKVVMVSSIGHQGIIKRALACGAKHFITKPIRPDQVATVVNFVLGES